MSIHEICKDVFFIERGYLNGNHFVCRSPSTVLIDTGFIGDFDETKAGIESVGVPLPSVETIINTHCHCDHIGGNRYIQDQSDCEIWLHKIGAHFIRNRDDWSTWRKYFDQEAEFFTVTRELEDGDMILVGSHEFQVVHTPGHSVDGIVLYHPKEKFLISSDALWENDLPAITIRIEGSGALFAVLESLDKIAALDVKTVFPGHGKPFGDVKKAISKSRKKAEKYLENSEKVGEDLIKKICVYTVMMRKSVDEERFFSQLMDTHWYPETVDFYFNGQYEPKYTEIVTAFLERGVLYRKNGRLFTSVNP